MNFLFDPLFTHTSNIEPKSLTVRTGDHAPPIIWSLIPVIWSSIPLPSSSCFFCFSISTLCPNCFTWVVAWSNNSGNDRYICIDPCMPTCPNFISISQWREKKRTRKSEYSSVQTLESGGGRRKPSLEDSSFMYCLRSLSNAFRSTLGELLPRRGILSKELLITSFILGFPLVNFVLSTALAVDKQRYNQILYCPEETWSNDAIFIIDSERGKVRQTEIRNHVKAFCFVGAWLCAPEGV